MRAAEPGAVAWRRILWRCRRGMKELDFLLERYTHAKSLPVSAAERGTFARLLDLPDPELMAYLLGEDVPGDPELAGLVRRISRGPRASGDPG